MSTKLKFAVKAAIAGVALTVSGGVYAAGAVFTSSWTGSDNVVGAGETISTVAGAFGANMSWTDNSDLKNSAWGHALNVMEQPYRL